MLLNNINFSSDTCSVHGHLPKKYLCYSYRQLFIKLEPENIFIEYIENNLHILVVWIIFI